MKTVFIINPKAGSEKNIDDIVRSIQIASAGITPKPQIYITKSVGDAERFVSDYCLKIGKARFIACGGDGTLSEVLNGAIGYEDCEIGVIPLGTGNDFCRNFEDSNAFLDISAQLLGKAVKCDAIQYKTTVFGKEKFGYCANMFNIGFDCNVADMTASMKKKPLISGSLAYFLSIFAVLIKKKGANLCIELDGNIIHKGKLLLTSIANGKFCGGGIKSNPLASFNDGFININIIHNISRLNFISKLPFYMKGTHIRLKNIEKIIFSEKCKKVVITPLDNSMRICIDGEIITAGKTEFNVIHNAFSFVIPEKSSSATLVNA